MKYEQMVRWLLVVSVIAIVLGPMIMMIFAFSANGLFIGAALLIIGALGLYAGMRALKKESEANSPQRE
jgi:hypothetical protein